MSEDLSQKIPMAPARTVQEYIDETPFWPDGTEVTSAPMTRMQWRIWMLATGGKFFEGLVIFMTGVAMPLIVDEFSLGAAEKGMVASAALFGILVGATALGGLADSFGRKKMFIVEMLLFVLFLAGLTLSVNFAMVLVCLFGIGLALGCDYPTAHMVISESIPSRMRGRLVLGAFAFQAVGALAGTAVGYFILVLHPEQDAWRWMYATALVPAMLVGLARFFIPDSGHWLVSRGKIEKAEHETQRLLSRTPSYPKLIRIRAAKEHRAAGAPPVRRDFRELFSRKYWKSTVLASVPWFLQDLSTYGIGIFTPTILASMVGSKSEHPSNLSELIHNDILAAKGAAIIDVLLIVGIICAVLLADRVGRIRLQILGFIGCAVGLFIASLSVGSEGNTGLFYVFTGFMIFSFMTNLGPNAMTYLLAGEVYPTPIRGKGAGFAASVAKVGAVLTAFLFPILLHNLGTTLLLYILVGASLLGALVTWIFAIETTGVNLEKI